MGLVERESGRFNLNCEVDGLVRLPIDNRLVILDGGCSDFLIWARLQQTVQSQSTMALKSIVTREWTFSQTSIFRALRQIRKGKQLGSCDSSELSALLPSLVLSHKMF